MFLHHRLVAMLVAPLITMRLIAEERKLGSLEVLWSLPLRDHEVLFGKLAAALVVYGLMLGVSAIGPLALHAQHPYALGPLVAGYVGMALLGLVFLTCGLAASAVSENQVVAAMGAYGVLVFLWFVSTNEAALSEHVGWLIVGLSLFDRFTEFAQGVIDSRHVVFFLAFAAFFLFLGLRGLGARAWRGLG
jgi:ABC-2 type transport system permease protein